MKNFLRKIKARLSPPKYGFFGNYTSWSAALADSSGYDSPNILEKVRASALKVKRGEAAFERDSVAFAEKQYSQPVVDSLLSVASREDNTLNVLDFGGSLGSSYYQNKDLLEHLKSFRWNVVEQGKFVEAGKKDFEGGNLHFYKTIEECLKETQPNVLFVSSVLQYLEKPYEFLEKFVSQGFKYLIFDRTAFFPDKDRLTVQKVRPGIYNASYPAWFLNEKRFFEIVGKKYKLVNELQSLRSQITVGNETASEKGFFFVKL